MDKWPIEVERELKSLRADVDRLHAVVHAKDYVDHCKAIDDMANDFAGMTSREQEYFARQGKTVPAFRIKLADWWRKFKWRHGF